MIVDAARAVRVEHEVSRRGGLDLKRHGSELIGPCPRCGGTDRFAISIIKQCFLCRGCGASGDVIALVQHLDGVDFRGAAQLLGGEMSDPCGQNAQTDHRPIELVNQPAVEGQDTKWALQIWSAAIPIAGAIAETYLHRRGLQDLPDDGVLRFHPSCPFGKTRTACLIALYRDIITDEPKAISRTAVDAAGGKIGRMSLGPVGGAAIKIDADENVEQGLTIGEGLETCLAGRQLGFKPVWAVGSAKLIKTFPVLSGITSLTVLVDNDAPDHAGRRAGQTAAIMCSARWTAADIEVSRIVPRGIGVDMADLIEHEGRSRHAAS